MLLEGSDGHTLWANSAALAAAHIGAATKDPAGGRIEHDAAGNPTGTLRDTATEIVLDARPAAEPRGGSVSARAGIERDARNRHHLGTGRGRR